MSNNPHLTNVTVCPVKNCEERVYKVHETKCEMKAKIHKHIRTHKLRQFTMPVFLWRLKERKT